MVPDDLRRIRQQTRATAVLSLQHDECLARWDIDYLKMSREGRNLGLAMVRLPIRDFDPVDMRRCLPGAVRALAKLQAQRHHTYVHCTAGISRAPLTVFAYLTLVAGLARDRALRLVMGARPESIPYWEAYHGARGDLAAKFNEAIERRTHELLRLESSKDAAGARERAEVEVLGAVLSR